MLGVGNFTTVQKIFYEKGYQFNNFKGLSNEKIKEIDEKVKQRKEENKKNTSYAINQELVEYQNLLQYLIHTKEFTFDEKIIFLIRYMDPGFRLLELYFDTDIVDNEDIKSEDNEFVQDSLTEYKEEQVKEFQSKCREITNVYDPYLIKYEQKLFHVLKIKDLKFGIKRNYVNLFYRKFNMNELDFNISKEKLDSILIKAKEYKEKYGIPSLNDIAFQLIEQPRTLGITDPVDAMIFLIYVVDSNFKLFSIYDEYCNWSDIHDACVKEVGYYNQDLIKSEIKFDAEFKDKESFSKFKEKVGN